jgi:hypothetical protein
MGDGRPKRHRYKRNLDREEHQETRELVKSAFSLGVVKK